MKRSIIVIIPFEITVGFAFSRLVGAFLQACEKAVGGIDDVHFSFSTLEDDGSSGLPEGFSNLVRFDPRSYGPADISRLCSYIRLNDIQAAFIIDASVQSTYFSAIRKAGIKAILSYYGAPLSSLNFGLKLIIKKLEVRYFRPSKPDHFIVESRSIQKTAVLGRGIPRHKITIIPTGVDESRFRPLVEHRSDVYQRFAIPQERSIVVYMGHLHRRKGVHVLLQAADQIVRGLNRRDIHFLFLGNRLGEEDEFRGLFDPGVTSQFITFGGYQIDIPELLAGCQIGCIPSTGWDSFPMSSLEMQACGLPVVASNCQGTPETIEDGRTGVVVPMGDVGALSGGLIRLVDDGELRQSMSSAAVQRIRASFTRRRQIGDLAQVICRVAGWPSPDGEAKN